MQTKCFEYGEIWKSPENILYKVMEKTPDGTNQRHAAVVLQKGLDRGGKTYLRYAGATENWILMSCGKSQNDG